MSFLAFTDHSLGGSNKISCSVFFPIKSFQVSQIVMGGFQKSFCLSNAFFFSILCLEHEFNSQLGYSLILVNWW